MEQLFVIEKDLPCEDCSSRIRRQALMADPINTKYNETYYNEKIKETEVIRLAILAPMIWLTVNIR